MFRVEERRQNCNGVNSANITNKVKNSNIGVIIIEMKVAIIRSIIFTIMARARIRTTGHRKSPCTPCIALT